MTACPNCAHQPPAGWVRCPACSTFLGSRRDLLNLGSVAISLLLLIGLCLLSNVVLPNLALGRAIAKVRHDDAEGIKVMAEADRNGQIAIDGKDLGWDTERFGNLMLVSFTYVLKDENPKRYAVWWVLDLETEKVTKIQKADEFIDGHLLRHGLKLILPDGA